MIGLAPPANKELHHYENWLNRRNLKFRILSKEDSLTDISLLILAGGVDVYKNVERDLLEFNWFSKAYQQIPILGICRGLQLANVALGGTLIQDLSPSEKEYHTASGDSKFHSVHLDKNHTFLVNSRHHQAIDRLAESLIIIGSSHDGIPEIVIGDNSLFVQWHPEREEVFDTQAELFCSDWIKSKLNFI